MGSRYTAVGCTLSCCAILAVRGLSVGQGKRDEKRTVWASHFMGPWFLGVFLQHIWKGPTSLREGERHLVVIACSEDGGK
jgi:hypothetical protein